MSRMESEQIGIANALQASVIGGRVQLEEDQVVPIDQTSFERMEAPPVNSIHQPNRQTLAPLERRSRLHPVLRQSHVQCDAPIPSPRIDGHCGGGSVTPCVPTIANTSTSLVTRLTKPSRFTAASPVTTMP